ncbi:CaiB/BaiF CoA transferase family protein [Candidatus Poriferisocius sp.]|uniref:CaiB/BaiF CoA transferase family protein n=1 Tax=Candidatus Poriferisocius sp. TaxID=3101276 RepID=UPI003B5A96F6
MTKGPLDGIRVVDLTRIFSGPICGRVLADLGADVIKVEPPSGDLTRPVPPVDDDGIGVTFSHMNAGKRNICVDLKAEGAPELVAALADQADVLLENYRPGVMARYGLSYEELSARNPRLVFCSITGFGQTGPWTHRRAHAPMMHAVAGTIELAARLREGEPLQEIHQHGDLYAGFISVSAVLAALYQREHTGTGQHLDVAMAETLIYANDQAGNDLSGYDGPRDFDTWNYAVARTADGQAVSLIGNPEQMLPRWVAALGGNADDCPDQPTREEALAMLRGLVAGFSTYEELAEVVEQQPLPAARISSVAELAASDWAADRGLIAEIRPGIPVPAKPFAMGDATVGVTHRSARLGEDTRSILADDLGLDDDEIAHLIVRGAVHPAD